MKRTVFARLSALVAAAAVALTGVAGVAQPALAAENYATPQEAGLNVEITKIQDADTNEEIAIGSTTDADKTKITLRLSSDNVSLNEGDTITIPFTVVSSVTELPSPIYLNSVPSTIADDETGEILFFVQKQSGQLVLTGKSKVNTLGKIDVSISFTTGRSGSQCSPSSSITSNDSVSVAGLSAYTSPVYHPKCVAGYVREDVEVKALESYIPEGKNSINSSDYVIFDALLKDYMTGNVTEEDSRLHKDFIVMHQYAFEDSNAVPAACKFSSGRLEYDYSYINVDSDGEKGLLKEATIVNPDTERYDTKTLKGGKDGIHFVKSASQLNLSDVAVAQDISSLDDAAAVLKSGESTCHINSDGTVVAAVNYGPLRTFFDSDNDWLPKPWSGQAVKDNRVVTDETGKKIELYARDTDMERIATQSFAWWQAQDIAIPGRVHVSQVYNLVPSTLDAYSYTVTNSTTLTEQGSSARKTVPARSESSGSGSVADASVQFVVPQVSGNAVVSEVLSGKAGENVVAPSVLKAGERTGYKLVSWNTKADGSGDTVNLGSDVALVRGQKVLYAQLEAIPYTVTFNSNSDDATGSTPALENLVYDTTVTLTANGFKRSGYNFKGWAKSSERANAGIVDYADKDTTFSVPAGDTELFAVWEIKTYTVTFKDDNGAVLKTETVEHGKPANPPAVPAKVGHTPKGWNADTSKITGDTVFTPVYEVNTYTVSFDKNGGVGETASVSGAYDSTVKLTPNKFTKAGSTFLGWATSQKDASAGFVDYADKDIFTIPAQDTVLYAAWVSDIIPGDDSLHPDNYVKVIFDSGEHGVLDGTDEAVFWVSPNKEISLVAPNVKPATGYVFSKWDKAYANTKFTKDTTITAQYTALADVIDGSKDRPAGYVTVTFSKGAHGSLSGASSFHVNPTKAVTLKAPSVKPSTGYTFSKWDKAYANTKFTKDTTITAQYAVVSGCEVVPAEKDLVKVYRMYHHGRSEHMFTTDWNEVRTLLARNWGWKYEGVSWYAPKSSGVPVYRLYNRGLDDHHYVTSKHEYDTLVKYHGWVPDNGGKPMFYSDECKRVTVYRMYNSGLKSGQHHHTADRHEVDVRTANDGWKYEGISWYATRWAYDGQK